MPSPFPGMNPYLEQPEFWSEVHHLLIGLIAETLNAQLLPKYRAAIEKRVYQIDSADALLVGIPDAIVTRSPNALANRLNTNSVNPSPIPAQLAIAAPRINPMTVQVPMSLEVREAYLEIREVATQTVITAIEVLSTNKRTGKGREAYEGKRQAVLASRTHLIEIDLLRSGEPMPIVDNPGVGSYRILVSRGDRRPQSDLYLFDLPEPIPLFPVPLRAGDREPMLDLHQLLDTVYDRAGYAVVIDYQQKLTPALSVQDTDWVNDLLQQRRLR